MAVRYDPAARRWLHEDSRTRGRAAIARTRRPGLWAAATFDTEALDAAWDAVGDRLGRHSSGTTSPPSCTGRALPASAVQFVGATSDERPLLACGARAGGGSYELRVTNDRAFPTRVTLPAHVASYRVDDHGVVPALSALAGGAGEEGATSVALTPRATLVIALDDQPDREELVASAPTNELVLEAAVLETLAETLGTPIVAAKVARCFPPAGPDATSLATAVAQLKTAIERCSTLAGDGFDRAVVLQAVTAVARATRPLAALVGKESTRGSIRVRLPQVLQTGAVLGVPELAPNGEGWGTVAPTQIFNGGVPSGLVKDIRWRNWGAPTAYGSGLNAIYKPEGGYYPELARIELRANHLGTCRPGGPPAYEQLSIRAPSRPGGPLGEWMPWAGWKTLCESPF